MGCLNAGRYRRTLGPEETFSAGIRYIVDRGKTNEGDFPGVVALHSVYGGPEHREVLLCEALLPRPLDSRHRLLTLYSDRDLEENLICYRPPRSKSGAGRLARL